MKKAIVGALSLAVVAVACTNAKQGEKSETTAKGDSVQVNQLTDQEKKDGWVLLFDGKTTDGWHTYNQDTIGAAWVVEDGALTLSTEKKDGWQAKRGGDIVTENSYKNYEFSLEWKISKNGNSGIIYNVVEKKDISYPWQTGTEMQILDNDGHSDGKIHKHRSGDLYDLIPCTEETVKAVGEWNQIRIVQKDGKVEHWLNGTKVVEYDMNSPKWPELIAGSKFKDMSLFGKSQEGRIALQDHGNKVSFRNIKIRKL